jgi:hypothetical protein
MATVTNFSQTSESSLALWVLILLPKHTFLHVPGAGSCTHDLLHDRGRHMISILSKDNWDLAMNRRGSSMIGNIHHSRREDSTEGAVTAPESDIQDVYQTCPKLSMNTTTSRGPLHRPFTQHQRAWLTFEFSQHAPPVHTKNPHFPGVNSNVQNLSSAT